MSAFWRHFPFMGGCLVPQRHIYSGLERGGIEYVLVCLPVKDGKSLVTDFVREVLEKGKFYPKPVLAAGDGYGAQCFAYEEGDTDAKQRGVKLRRFSSQLKQS
ncbi:hypothetical protein DMI72_09035 [Akkermansia muciniphila]|nr:hypothetical protein DMI71_08915 [Akkermansia muciniphila]QHV56320.1 hypothetical protein DMI72_09035 [Akkermansia muciniphila]QHV58687.1 hypothetical protein DMI73_08945 [Akkermansia muciniphila]QHV59878.1 hypothetical protein DMI74_02330 [Akkermansia muciniphila]